jgi:hypothetical protein
MSNAAGNVSWRAAGEGLGLRTAREVARRHGVTLDVVLKGISVPPGVKERLDSVEDHVVVKNGEHLIIKFTDYGQFTEACVLPRLEGIVGIHTSTLTVVIMPYADLTSCKKINELSTAATPQLHGYLRIEIANRGLLLQKLRATATVDNEARRVRDLGAQIESLGRGLFPANKYPRSSGSGRLNRQIAMERLMKAHLDAKQYGDAHDLLLLLDKGKHDAIFGCYDPCRRPSHESPADQAEPEKKKAVADCLEGYKKELDGKHGSDTLDPLPERAGVLRMEARCVFQRELADARTQVIDIVETAVQQLESIAEQLLAAGTEPSLLGFGVSLSST